MTDNSTASIIEGEVVNDAIASRVPVEAQPLGRASLTIRSSGDHQNASEKHETNIDVEAMGDRTS